MYFFFIFRLLSSFIKENGLWMWTSIGKSKSCLQEKRSCRCKRLGKVSTRLDYESTCLSVLNVHNHDSSDDKSVTNWFIWPWKLLVLHKYIWYLYISQLLFFFPIYNIKWLVLLLCGRHKNLTIAFFSLLSTLLISR